MDDCSDRATSRSHLEADEILGPVFVGLERSSLGGEDVEAANLLGSAAIGDADERDLMTLVPPARGVDRIGAIVEVDDRARLEEREILFLQVNAEKAVEAVGAAETTDAEPLLSRGTRPQR